MTHADLILRAGRWLRNTVRCGVVLLDGQCITTGEIPDAIGFRGAWSVLVECKASLSDFYADRRKPNRHSYAGRTIPHVGQERWYLCPAGVVDPARHTLPAGWGLLWATSTRIRSMVSPPFSVLDPKTRHLRVFDSKIRVREHDLLLSAIMYYQHARRARKAEA